MKTFTILLPFFIIMLLSCSEKKDLDLAKTNNALDTLKVGHSMKGWELYSWQSENKWYYSVLVGTNRTKTTAEITSKQTSATKLLIVTGTDSLKLLLNKFPQSESILWLGRWPDNRDVVQLPSQEVQDEIVSYGTQKGLTIHVNK